MEIVKEDGTPTDPYLEEHGMVRSRWEAHAGIFRIDEHLFVLDDIVAMLVGVGQKRSNLKGQDGQPKVISVKTLLIHVKQSEPVALAPEHETVEQVQARWTTARAQRGKMSH